MTTYLLYSVLCQLVCYGAYWLGFRHKSQFHWNRFFLLGSLGLSLVLPLFKGAWLRKDAYMDTMILPDISIAVSELAVEQVSEQVIHFTPIAWVFVSLLILGVTAWRLYMLFALIKNAPKVPYAGYTLVYVPDTIPTCSFGKYILWPESQSIEEHRAVLWHELAHLKEKHTIDILFISLLHTVFWMNPMIWLYGRELKSQHEFLADRKAIAEATSVASGSPEAYIKLLVTSVLKQANLGYVHTFHESNIKTRIKMIKSWNKTAISWKQIGSALAFCALMGLGIACTETTVSDTQEVEIEALSHSTQEGAIVENPSEPATIKGGFDVLVKALQENLKYPEAAKEANINGKVFVSFIVDTNGKMTDFSIVKSLGHGCDEAAIEVLKNAAIEWNPAKMEGKLVKQKLVLPIQFAI